MLRQGTYLLSVFLLCSSAWADQSFPQTAEVDLIFPLNDTYRSVHPFPFVFALRNPAAAWPFDFHFSYTLEVYNKEEDRFMRSVNGFQHSGHFPHAMNTGDTEYTGDDPFVAINATSVMTGMNETFAILTWDIGLSYNCSENMDPQKGVPPARRFEKQIYFSVSNNGSMPDFSASSPCPKLIGTFGISGETQPPRSQQDSEKCAILSEKQPKGDPCELEINDKIATKVANTMTDFINCPEGKWPNPTATTCAEMSRSGPRLGSSLGWMDWSCGISRGIYLNYHLISIHFSDRRTLHVSF